MLARLVVKGFETRLKGRLATPPCPAPKRRGRPRTAPTHHTPSNGRARPSLSHAHHSAASLRRPPPPTVPTVASLQRGKTSSPQTTQVSREETDVRASVSLSRVSYARSRATHSSRSSTPRRGPPQQPAARGFLSRPPPLRQSRRTAMLASASLRPTAAQPGHPPILSPPTGYLESHTYMWPTSK